MLGFGPEMWLTNEFVCSDVGSGTHNQPVEWDKIDVLHQVVISPLGAPNHIVVHIEEISNDEREYAHI